MPAVPQTKATWTDGTDALSSTNLHAYLRDPIRYLMSRPVAQLRRNSAQSVPTGTWTAINFTVEDIDSDPDGIGGHSTSSNTSRYTVRYPGLYQITGGVGWDANTTGRRGIRLAKNGTVIDGSAVLAPANSAGETAYPARPTLVTLDEGDYVEMQAYQASGGSLNLHGTFGDLQPTMVVTWERL